MSGPRRVRATTETEVTVCPLCGHELTGYHNLKNGRWEFEPVELFGITNPDDGMVCMSWDEHYVWFYYHSPEAVEQGKLVNDSEDGL